MIPLVEDLSQDFNSSSDLVGGIFLLTYMGVFDYKDGIPVNSVVFAGNVSYSGYASDLQKKIDFLSTNGSTVTIVFVDPDLDLTVLQSLTNVSIVQWSDNPTELLTNIRKNMRCGGGEPVHRPCKIWFSFIPDYTTTLSETDYNTQITFIKNEVGRMNRPDKIQVIQIIYNSYGCLNTTLQVLSNVYYSKDRTEYQPPYTALVFIPTTESYENYGGAEEVAQNLTDAAIQATQLRVDFDQLLNLFSEFYLWKNKINLEIKLC
ncbi:hypothetical protein FO519_009884 [Halicephalobus sp. NKZ332]|nr:hypothetical protein FO519_009884 [Halicephalobus sp. NKZ332]